MRVRGRGDEGMRMWEATCFKSRLRRSSMTRTDLGSGYAFSGLLAVKCASSELHLEDAAWRLQYWCDLAVVWANGRIWG